MKKTILIFFNLILLGLVILTVFYLFTKKSEIFASENSHNLDKVLDVNIPGKILVIKREKAPEKEIRGLYLTSNTAGLPNRIDSFIKALKNSNLNAVVIDIKDYSGQIAY